MNIKNLIKKLTFIFCVSLASMLIIGHILKYYYMYSYNQAEVEINKKYTAQVTERIINEISLNELHKYCKEYNVRPCPPLEKGDFFEKEAKDKLEWKLMFEKDDIQKNILKNLQWYHPLQNFQICVVAVSVLSFSAIVILLALLGYHFLKNNSEKLTVEQRLGIVVLISSIFPLLYYIVVYIKDGKHEVDEISLYAGIILLTLGAILVFNLVSSLVSWIKFGKK